MTEEKFAYAVTSVRIKESTLLGTDFLEQLLATRRYDDVRRQLAEHGWLSPVSEDDDQQLQKLLVDSRELIDEVSPEPGLLDALILKNDYHNLKAALKCSFTGVSPEKYFIKPCLYDTDGLSSAVSERRYEDLPEHMREAAGKAHEVYTRTQDGQYADLIIDAAALAATRDAGILSDSPVIRLACELLCAAADVKTAIRAIRTKKDAHFLDTALCECATIDKSELKAASLNGEEALISYLSQTPYGGAAQTLKENGNDSLSALEKWFDDYLIGQIQYVKSTFFGPDPLAAFYLAREIELRNIRILLSGKRHGVDDTVIRERMRRLYV